MIVRRAALIVAAAFPLAVSAQTTRVRVGPNVLVTHDGNVPHAELWIAAHPTDPNTLLGMSHAVRDAGSHMMLEMYASRDGGFSWTGIVHPQELAKGGWDPIVGFSARGTMLGVSLGDGGMWIYRSEDGGVNWDGRIAGRGDHQRMAVDYSSGAHAGRIYLASETGDGMRGTADSMHRAVSLWYSDDDGRTWSQPVRVARNVVGGVAVAAMAVLSDGTLTVLLQRYPNPTVNLATPTWDLEMAFSSDGGATFTTRPVGPVYFGGYEDLRRRQTERLPDVAPTIDAAADSKSARFRDRMYVVYVESRRPAEGGRVVTRYSADRGVTWSQPRAIFPETRGVVSQFQPAIAVNRDGTVGILWLDTRETSDRDSYHAYFSASTDGGETWSSPSRLTSEASRPFAAANVRPVPYSSSQATTGARLTLFSAYARWPNGGDYIGLAADAAGVFHPFWPDARTGIYEIYTSRVEVLPSVAAVAQTPVALERRSLNEQVALVTDPIRVDFDKGELLMPVRLKNVSRDTLYGPFTVRLQRIGGPTRPGGTEDAAQLLNASGGPASGPGAEMDYSRALRDLTVLVPNAVTEAVLWRVKPATLRNTAISIVADILGSVRAAPSKR